MRKILSGCGLCGSRMCTSLILSLLLPYYFIVSTLAFPPIITNLTADWASPNEGIENSESHCATKRPTGPPLPLMPDCTRAIYLLPENDYIGIFHIGGGPSLWRLPRSRSYESCTVLLTLHEDFDEEKASWLGVKDAATLLSIACRLPFEQTGEQRTGGWVSAGAEKGLVVQLVGSRNIGVDGMGPGAQQGMNGVGVE